MHDRAIPQIARRRSEAGVGEGQAETPVSGCCEAETLGHSELTKSPEIHPLLAGLKIDEGIRKFARPLTNIKNKNKMHGGTFFYLSILPVEQQSGKRRREAASSNDQSKNEN